MQITSYVNYLLVFCLIIFGLEACSVKEEPGVKLAKKWCDCYQNLVPMVKKLEDASSPQAKEAILDSMSLLSAMTMECMGGESALHQLDQNMSNEEKTKFNNSFRRVREETCPEVLYSIESFEKQLAQ